MKRLILAAVVSLGAMCSPAMAATNLVVNGDFENNGLTDWTSSRWGTNINGVISGAFSASTGCVGPGCIRDDTGAFQTTGGGAFLYQDLATVAGQSYTLDFDFGAAGFTNELVALFGDTVAFDGFNLPSSDLHYSVSDLVASGTTTRLLFLGRQDPSYNRLDNVSVTASDATAAVPEPATWAMMLLGFGAIGFAMRKSRQQPQVRYSFA